MGDVIPFRFCQDDEDFEIRVLTRNGDPWFVLNDVCAVLGLVNSSASAARLDEDEKGVTTIDTLGGPQDVTVISEPGLYNIIRTSRKLVAKRFRRWVDHEVLPSIRKTGSYSHVVAPTQDTLLERITIAVETQAQAVGYLATDVGTVKTDVVWIKDEQKNQGIRLKAVEAIVREHKPGRRAFTKGTVGTHIRVLMNVFHRLCPICNRNEIVSCDGDLLPNARKDHYEAVNKPDVYHTWIICDEDHDLRHKRPTDHFDPDFRNYQQKLRRFIDPAADQLEMFRRVA